MIRLKKVKKPLNDEEDDYCFLNNAMKYDYITLTIPNTLLAKCFVKTC